MSALFQPLSLRSVSLKNRIVVSPMCQYSSTDGFANDWHLVHLGSRAVGGAGLIITEATAISPEGRISPQDLGIYNDAHIEGLQRITTFISGQGAVAGIQLAHAGRKASTRRPWEPQGVVPPSEGGWTPVAPSPLPFHSQDPAPLELDAEGIRKVIRDFRTAAARALKAGFQLIELHAAHGYLIHQFLSPLTNQRSDDYGGSFENRTRLLLEVVRAVREVWPEELPLIVRISATDWHEDGWSVNDSVRLGKVLKEQGIDLIDCSTGGIVSGVRITTGPLYQLRFAEQVRRDAGIKTGAVGMITTAAEAEQIVAGGSADLVFMARELLRDPHFPLHAAKELGADISWPPQYERAKR